MVSYKLCIADPKKGRSYQKEVKDDEASPFVGMKIDDAVKGELIGLPGFELKITGGSDKCGFPMRHGILGIRKRINIYSGVGFRGKSRLLKKGKKTKRLKGLKKRKTICGHKINESVSQINMIVVKEGAKPLNEVMGVEDKAKGEAPKAEKKGEKAEEKKPKEAPKPEVKKEEPKEEKPEKKEEPKEEKPAKKEDKAEDKKEVKPKEEKKE
jgi:small subunit ribosomal protein S6e